MNNHPTPKSGILSIRVPLSLKQMLQKEAQNSNTDVSKLSTKIFNDFFKQRTFIKKAQENKAKTEYLEYLEAEEIKSGDYTARVDKIEIEKPLTPEEIKVNAINAFKALIITIVGCFLFLFIRMIILRIKND